ncbi:MAG: hypothetical protein KAW12_12725 [Candidatus Aminicenantes bacterium]|nr:hypothetical protein [Candidatus Aminicenantes bacterium]
MSEIVVSIKNEAKGKFLLDFLRQIEFIEIRERIGSDISGAEKEGSFSDLYGIWKDRDISLESIRKKAWKER